jgi:hypothetical protein
MLKPALRLTPKLAAPKRVEEIPAYIARAQTESEKRLAVYLTQVKKVCDAAKPDEMPDIPEFLQRKRPPRLRPGVSGGDPEALPDGSLSKSIGMPACRAVPDNQE